LSELDCRKHSYYVILMLLIIKTVPVAARSNAWVDGRSLAGIAGWNPAVAWISVCCECCGRGLCDGPISRPEES